VPRRCCGQGPFCSVFEAALGVELGVAFGAAFGAALGVARVWPGRDWHVGASARADVAALGWRAALASPETSSNDQVRRIVGCFGQHIEGWYATAERSGCPVSRWVAINRHWIGKLRGGDEPLDMAAAL